MDYCLINKPVRAAVPTFEPVTLQEAKRQCGLALDGDYHDATLSRLIQTARETVEQDTGIICATGTFTLKFTDWPDAEHLELRSLRPASSITSIVYIAGDGTSTTWSSSEYSLDTGTVVPTIKLGYAYQWPSLRGDLNGITVTLVAGHASQSAVPAMVKQAVLLNLAHQWKTEAGEDVRDYQTAYESIIAKLGRATYP